MTKTDNYIQQINRIYPDLEINTAKFNKDGQYNDVLIINGNLVFRFARVKPAIETLKQEIEILQHIQDNVRVAVPNPVYHSDPSATVGSAFMGYRLIAGEPLWRENFQAIPDDAKKVLARQIATFLRELHSTPAMATFPIRDTLDKWEDMYQRIKSKLYPLMREDAREQVTYHFETFLNAPQSFTPCLRHGDFGTGNILIDPDTHHLAGIIDFGFAGAGDPATDFAGLLICYGEAFYAECASHYPAMKTALPWARFYIGTFALQEALFGIENDDQEALKAGLATYI